MKKIEVENHMTLPLLGDKLKLNPIYHIFPWILYDNLPPKIPKIIKSHESFMTISHPKSQKLFSPMNPLALWLSPTQSSKIHRVPWILYDNMYLNQSPKNHIVPWILYDNISTKVPKIIESHESFMTISHRKSPNPLWQANSYHPSPKNPIVSWILYDYLTPKVPKTL